MVNQTLLVYFNAHMQLQVLCKFDMKKFSKKVMLVNRNRKTWRLCNGMSKGTEARLAKNCTSTECIKRERAHHFVCFGAEGRLIDREVAHQTSVSAVGIHVDSWQQSKSFGEDLFNLCGRSSAHKRLEESERCWVEEGLGKEMGKLKFYLVFWREVVEIFQQKFSFIFWEFKGQDGRKIIQKMSGYLDLKKVTINFSNIHII